MVAKNSDWLVGASVSGTWSSRAHMPALKASEEFELTAVCTTNLKALRLLGELWC